MSFVLQRLFSIKCYHCQQNSIDTRLGLCTDCSLEISRIPRNFSCTDLLRETWAVDSYHGPMGTLLRRAKYRPDRKLMGSLGYLMAAGSLELPSFDAIVHVPVPWHRKLHRGFDQAEILAASIQRQLRVPHIKVLRRHGFQEQASKTIEERREKILDRFSCDLKQELPASILLVDDVVTTGNTLEGCAAELYQQGVRQIIGFSLLSALL